MGLQAIEPIIGVLSDSHERVRERAAWALGEMTELKDPHVVELLIAALKDEYWEVRSATVGALNKWSSPQAMEPLLAALNDKHPSVRERAAKALTYLFVSGFKDVRAFDPLVVALGDEHDATRSAVAEALGWLGDARAVEPLITALETDEH